MAGWGAMIGIGQGLQNFGGILLDYNKSKMREQLELEREQRQVQRELDKEQRALERELTTPTEWRPVQDESGNTYLQAFNSHGKAIQGESRPMSKYEADAFARQQRMAELELTGKEQSVTNLGLEGQIKGFQVRDYDDDRAVRRRQLEASIEASLASAQASRSRAMGAGSRGSAGEGREPHPLEYANALVKDYKAAFERYGIEDGADQQRIAELAVQGAVAEGITPAEYLLRYLSNLGD